MCIADNIMLQFSEKHPCGRKRSGKESGEVLFCCLETVLEMGDNFKWLSERIHRMVKLEYIEASNHLPKLSIYTEDAETQRDQLMVISCFHIVFIERPLHARDSMGCNYSKEQAR